MNWQSGVSVPRSISRAGLAMPNGTRDLGKKAFGYKFEVGCPEKMSARYSKLGGQCASFANFCTVLSFICWIFPVAIHDICCFELNFQAKNPKKNPVPSILRLIFVCHKKNTRN